MIHITNKLVTKIPWQYHKKPPSLSVESHFETVLVSYIIDNLAKGSENPVSGCKKVNDKNPYMILVETRCKLMNQEVHRIMP